MVKPPSAARARSISIARSGASKQGTSRPAISSTRPVWPRWASLRMTGVGGGRSVTGRECTEQPLAESLARRTLGAMTSIDDRAAVQALRGCPLFAPCPEPVLADVGRRLRHRHFRRNEVIFHQGDPGDALHVIIGGAVKILLPSAEGDEAIIATLRPGDFFGELSLLDGRPRSATATTVEPSETLSLAAGRVPRARAAAPGAARRTLRRAWPACCGASPSTWKSCISWTWRAGLPLAFRARSPGAPRRQRDIELDWPYHPIRSGGHDRRHAAEREPAAGRPDR